MPATLSQSANIIFSKDGRATSIYYIASVRDIVGSKTLFGDRTLMSNDEFIVLKGGRSEN